MQIDNICKYKFTREEDTQVALRGGCKHSEEIVFKMKHSKVSKGFYFLPNADLSFMYSEYIKCAKVGDTYESFIKG